MKKTSRIINVARGGIINEEDLAKSLNEDIIAGAAIDVFESEPISIENDLIKAKNLLLVTFFLGICFLLGQYLLREYDRWKVLEVDLKRMVLSTDRVY